MVKSLNQAESSEIFPLPCLVCGLFKTQNTSKLFFVIAQPCMHVYCYECAASREFHGDVPKPDCPICDKKVVKILVVRGQPESSDDAALLFASKELLARHFAERIYYDESWEADYDMDYVNVLEKFLKLSYFSCSGCTEKGFERNLKLLNYDQVTLNYVSRHIKEKHGYYVCRLCFYNLKPFSICQNQVSKGELLHHMQTGTPNATGLGRTGNSECELCKFDGDKFSPAWVAQWHWDEDALTHHLADHHVKCDLCTKFLADQDKFEEHLKLMHDRRIHAPLADDHCNTGHAGVEINFAEILANRILAGAKDGRVVSQVVAHVESPPDSDSSAENIDSDEANEDFVIVDKESLQLPAPLQLTPTIEKRLQSLSIADQKTITSTVAQTAPSKITLANRAGGVSWFKNVDASAYPTLQQASGYTISYNDDAYAPSNPNNNWRQRDGGNNNRGFVNGNGNLANGTGVDRGGNTSGTNKGRVNDGDNTSGTNKGRVNDGDNGYYFGPWPQQEHPDASGFKDRGLGKGHK